MNYLFIQEIYIFIRIYLTIFSFFFILLLFDYQIEYLRSFHYPVLSPGDNSVGGRDMAYTTYWGRGLWCDKRWEEQEELSDVLYFFNWF